MYKLTPSQIQFPDLDLRIRGVEKKPERKMIKEWLREIEEKTEGSK